LGGRSPRAGGWGNRVSPSPDVMVFEKFIRYAGLAVGLMVFEKFIRYAGLAVGLKPSARGCEGRLRGLERMMYSKTIRPRLRNAKPACAGYTGLYRFSLMASHWLSSTPPQLYSSPKPCVELSSCGDEQDHAGLPIPPGIMYSKTIGCSPTRMRRCSPPPNLPPLGGGAGLPPPSGGRAGEGGSHLARGDMTRASHPRSRAVFIGCCAPRECGLTCDSTPPPGQQSDPRPPRCRWRDAPASH